MEFWDRIREILKNPAHANRPHLLHLGFKWDPFAPAKKAVTRYTWHPWLTGRQILERIRQIVDPQRYRHLENEFYHVFFWFLRCRADP